MNIILSNFFNNYTYNKELINNFSLSPYTQIKGVHGSFPFSFFSTGVNENIRSEVCVYPDMEGCIKNCGTLEMIILNYDDPITKEMESDARVKAKVVYFSRLHSLEEGIFIKNSI